MASGSVGEAPEFPELRGVELGLGLRPELFSDRQINGFHSASDIIKVAGVDHVGLGSDFDGISSVPRQLEDVSTYPNITQELLNRGHGREAIHKILGGNVLRALRAAEDVAKNWDKK